MVWSRQKKIFKSRLCDSLKDRVDIHIIKYRSVAHGDYGRAVVTLDKEDILSLITLTFYDKKYELERPLYSKYLKEKESRGEEQGKRSLSQLNREHEEYMKKVYEPSIKLANEQGYFSESQFYDAVNMCINISIEDAIKSEDILVRALSMFDRRLGKRRLIKMYDSIESEHDLVKKFYEIRINAEKILKNQNYIRQ